MKYLIILYVFLLSSCSSLTNYQEQPVVELSDGTFNTTCNGMAEAFDNCYRKAKRTCSNGYDVIEKVQLKDFIHREIIFKCK